jgi:hypothetical protein
LNSFVRDGRTTWGYACATAIAGDIAGIRALQDERSRGSVTRLSAFADVLPTIIALRDHGLSLRAIAKRLNVEYPRAEGSWQATQVKRVLDRTA